MEYVILILIMFVGVNTAVKLSFWKLWQVFIAGAAMALFVVLTYPLATELSKTELTAMVQTSSVMQNIAVIVTLETAVFFAFSFVELKKLMGKKKVNPLTLLTLRYYPGLLVYPILFFVLGHLMFSFPGVAFNRLGYTMAVTLLITVPFVSWGIKKQLPEEEYRLELLFISNLLTCIIGLITTVNGNTVYKSAGQTLDVYSLLMAIGIFTLFFTIGFLFSKFKKRKIN